MEMKNAVGVCLISFFSATMVVLIARWLDARAEGRLEPQLAAIVEELRAIRKQGVVAPAPGEAVADVDDEDGLVVYYFHGKTRCPTCRSIEAQAKAVVQTDFADEMKRGELVWKILNYESPAAAELAGKFEVTMPVVGAGAEQGRTDREMGAARSSLAAGER